MKSAPWAKFTTSRRPKMSTKPDRKQIKERAIDDTVQDLDEHARPSHPAV